MEINHLQSAKAMQEVRAGANNPAGTADGRDLKPILEGGLKVTVAERNVLDDIKKVECAEEPTLNDVIGELVRAAYKDMAMPQIPDFA